MSALKSNVGGTTFKFVASDGGVPQKRRQVAQACESCRKRKKRCHHTEPGPRSSTVSENVQHSPLSTSPSNTSHTVPINAQLDFPGHQFSPNSRVEGEQHHTETSPATSNTVEQNSQSTDLNQNDGEITKIVQTEAQEPIPIAQNQGSRSSRFIGDLNPEGVFLAATSPDASRGVSNDSIGVWLSSTLSRGPSQSAALPSLSPSNLFYGSGSLVQKVLVPMLEQECRSTIPPPEKVEALSKIYFEKVHPIFPVIDQEAYNNLSPTDPGYVLLQQGICLAASKNFISRPHLILAASSTPLMSCREFGEALSGTMRISIEMGLVSNKIVLIQALALMSQYNDNPVGEDISSQLCGRAVQHVQSLGIHLKGQQEDHRDRCSTTLLCCIWAIDRMNAAFNGRPVLMHERDLRKDLDQCFDQQGPCFRVFLKVIELLDKVIELYRPLPISGDQPALNWDFPAFEDVVVRCGGSQVSTSALATIETLYHAVAILSCRSKTWADPERSSMSYIRQSLSTSILSSTVIRELRDQLTLFPFVPYAISLSMSIVYREMRHSRLPLHRARSRAQFQILCDGLSELSGIFWSASTTSEMGKKLLKEMDRVASAVSASEARRPQQDINDPTIMGAVYDASSNFATQNTFGESAMASNDQISTPFDPSLFDSIADIDLFGMFDPAFDLDGFDACLESNLNPAFPNPFQ
ncbi:hypothetical protein N431DRAFT_440265 [Stipitochalara longipes BDJ]|nr:hypothetical protein N431DRAFT_440265 [Stipitochalara longipes BDJ]